MLARPIFPPMNSPPSPPLSRYRQKRNFALTSEPAGRGGRETRGWRQARCRSSSRSTGRAGCTTTSGSNSTACCSAGRCPRGRASTRRKADGDPRRGPSARPTAASKARSRRASTAPARSSSGTAAPGSRSAIRAKAWRKGKLVFKLHGEKLAGLWELVRIAKPGDKQDPWMLFKKRDAWARPLAEYDVIAALPDSVVEKPLGLVEEREPRALPAQRARRDRGAARKPDLPARCAAPLPAKLAAAARDPGGGRAAPATGSSRPSSTATGCWRASTRARRELVTRGGHDWTDKMKPLAAAIEGARHRLGLARRRDRGHERATACPTSTRCRTRSTTRASEAIDLLRVRPAFLDGRDLRKVPLRARRALLGELLEEQPSDRIRFSQSSPATPAQMLEAARSMQLEGIIVKRPDAPYVSQRTETWLKLKCAAAPGVRRSAASPTAAARAARSAACFLGYLRERRAGYAGNVGTGWNARTAARPARSAWSRSRSTTPTLAIERSRPAAGRGAAPAPSAGSGRSWSPRWRSREWTPEGHVRHPVFRRPAHRQAGARGDARGRGGRPGERRRQRRRRASSIKVTNPDRVIDPSTGIKKVDLVRYYESIAERILPHLQRPAGVAGAGARRHHRRAVLPEAPETRMPGLTRARPVAVAGPRGAARRRQRRRPRLRRADEHDRVPHLELDDAQDRPARPHDLRPRPRRRRDVAAAAGGRAADARAC